MDSAVLERMFRYAFRPAKHTQGLVVVRHGVIVAEQYEDGRDATSFATSWSVAKSFASALIGIAIDEGLIASADASMADFFPDWRGTDRAAIKLRDVLSMTSGLDWTESYSLIQPVLSDIARMASVESDHLAFASSKGLAYAPGTYWRYSSADTMLLSGVLESVTGTTAAEYAERKLFAPIGMAPVEWWSDAVGHTLTYCCIDTPTRELAKFGLLYARGGEWDGRQVVPAEWVAESTSAHPIAPYYGYQWWLGGAPESPSDTFMARGFDGQYIYVFPSLDLVVVRNGHYDKYPGEPIGTPTLFSRLPSAGLVAGLGSVPPDSWDDGFFLTLLADSIAG